MKGLLKIDIYDFLTMKIIEKLERHLDFTDIERDKLYYGVITLLINIIKSTFIFCIALFLGMIKEVLIIAVIIASLRLTSSGLHAKSNLMCTVITLVAYIGSSILSRNLSINYQIAFIICIVLTFILFRYSPADTENRPILGKEQRRKLKIQTLIIALIILIINFIVSNNLILNLTMYAMIVQTIAILPITYKILKRSCNNYEKYE